MKHPYNPKDIANTDEKETYIIIIILCIIKQKNI